MSHMHRERRRILFSGRVQGVGFRATCRSVARGFAVSGFVRNLPDGRVELVSEGDPAEIDGFLAAIQAEMDFFIADIHAEQESSADIPLSGFTIRH
jgi:acylphosphatase